MSNRDLKNAFGEWMCGMLSHPNPKAGVHVGIRNEYEHDYDFVADLYDDDVCPTEGVPYWEHTYIYSVADLQKANNLQKKFYRYFKAQFLKERYLDIEDNANYAFVLMFDLTDDYKKHKDYKLLKQQLDTLAENYPIVAQYIDALVELKFGRFINEKVAHIAVF